ncbi:MAG: hypothetical protein H6R01_931, partial [Burkholderiaceae bacterium]|nr:hypothetical protein [Burkholderiaceae bacterium]MBS1170013.1 hypothetical protein [Burkholderiaceae bacterium]
MPEKAIATGKATGVAAWVFGFLDWLGSIPLDKITALLVC